MTNKTPKETPYFIAAVKDQFKFLSNYGYHLTDTKGSTVRFQSEKVYVLFSYQWYTYEIEMKIGQTGNKYGYSFPEVVNAIMPGYKYACGYIASERKSIDAILKEIAHFILNNAKSLIAGEYLAFQELERTRSATLRKSELSHKIISIKKNAEECWKQKNYEEVKKLYSSIQSELTEVEQKRLQYAIQFSGA